MKVVDLREVAFARSGEKGDTAFLCVVAHDEADFPVLLREVTADVVQSVFEPLLSAPVERYELPKIGALNFVLPGAVGGGRTRNLGFEESGKALSSRLLALPVSVPDDFARVEWASA
jgi:hypothetical protein